ncbi:MAG: hypothetical protein ACK4QP_14000 [Pseudorhizobium sp.]
MVADASSRQPRSHIRQSDIARAIRGALQAGLEVREVIATRDGIRILSASSDKPLGSENSWDEVLDNG